MEVPFRTALQNDIRTLITLMEEYYAESGYRFDRQRAKSAFQQLIADPSLGQIWIAETKDTAVGYIVLTVGFSMEYGGRDSFLDDLYIRPGFRRSGLGAQALGILMAECRRRNVRAVHLEVGRDNPAAQKLYAKFGFKGNDRNLLTCRLEKVLHEL